jgi:branched-chain amino acid aminotransferase
MTTHTATSRPQTPATQGEKSVWLNGELLSASRAAVSVYDHGLLYGDGVFEGIRAYGGRILKMRSHVNRLFESARAIALNIPYSAAELESAMRDVLRANGLSDGYIRLVVTRGAGPLGLNPYLCKQPVTFIIADSIQLYPKEMYDNGLEIVTAATIRNHPAALSPRIKSLNYLNNIMAKVEGLKAGCAEALMLNHTGLVAECTGDNIFILRRGELLTPPIHAGILEGVTRNLVIELARSMDLAVREADMTRHDVYAADECFLTGTAAEVIPVTKLDARAIGDGRPGPVTMKLIAAFRTLVAHAPED